VPLDPRRAKRLAHRIRQVARRQKLPRVVLTSPLRRARLVGAFLARWGWRHRVDERLAEVHFGAWDGRRWDDIAACEIDAWCADFAHHAPGGGESLSRLFERCRDVLSSDGAASAAAVCVVGHAGWMTAAQHIAQGRPPPRQAAEWPVPRPYGGLMVLPAWTAGVDGLSAETPMPATISPNATA
jgi:alpha-ribazole phosphatase